LLPAALLHYVILLVAAAAIIAMQFDGWREARGTLEWLVMISAAVWLPGLIFRFRRVRESRERFAVFGGSANRDSTAAL
jgi:cyanate permease